MKQRLTRHSQKGRSITFLIYSYPSQIIYPGWLREMVDNEKKVNHAWTGLTVQLKGQNVEDTRGEYLLKQNSANIPKVPAVCIAHRQRPTRPGHSRASAGLNVLRSAARQARPHSAVPQVNEHPSTPLKPEAMGDCHGCGRYFRRSISGGDLCAEKPTDLDEARKSAERRLKKREGRDEPPEGLDSPARSTSQAQGRGSLLELGSSAIGKQPADLLSATSSDTVCTLYPFTALSVWQFSCQAPSTFFFNSSPFDGNWSVKFPLLSLSNIFPGSQPPHMVFYSYMHSFEQSSLNENLNLLCKGEHFSSIAFLIFCICCWFIKKKLSFMILLLSSLKYIQCLKAKIITLPDGVLMYVDVIY